MYRLDRPRFGPPFTHGHASPPSSLVHMLPVFRILLMYLLHVTGTFKPEDVDKSVFTPVLGRKDVFVTG